jgi:hypothetical protein
MIIPIVFTKNQKIALTVTGLYRPWRVNTFSSGIASAGPNCGGKISGPDHPPRNNITNKADNAYTLR